MLLNAQTGTGQEKGPPTKKRRRGPPTLGFRSLAASSDGGHQSSTKILLDNIPVLLAGIWQDDYHSQLKATITLRRLVTTDFKPHTDGVIQLNVLPRLLKFLSDKDFPKLQYEAAWALTNISAENTKVIVEIGAVSRFIKLLGGGSARKIVRELAIGALGNIAGDSPEYRDLVLRHSAMTPLLSQFKKPMKLRALRDAARTLSNFCSGKPQPSFEQTKPALPVLERLVQSKDEEVLTETCSALSYLSDGPNDRRQAVINAGIVPHLVKLVSHPSPSVLIRVLHTIGNIVTGGDDDETLVTVLQTADFEVKEEEAACEISKATHMQIEFLVKQGCINPICNLLASQYPRIIMACLEALENILKDGEAEKNLDHVNLYASMIVEAEGHKKIQNLQSHENNDVNQKAAKILKTFWTEDGQGKDEKHAPQSGS